MSNVPRPVSANFDSLMGRGPMDILWHEYLSCHTLGGCREYKSREGGTKPKVWHDGYSDVKSGLNRLVGSTHRSGPIIGPENIVAINQASAVPITNHSGRSDKRRVFPDGVG